MLQARAAAYRLSEDERAAHGGDVLIEAVVAHRAASPVVGTLAQAFVDLFLNGKPVCQGQLISPVAG